MLLRLIISASLASGLALAAAGASMAGETDNSSQGAADAKGKAERRGGYSYTYGDSTNTNGDGRSLNGGAAYRDPMLNKQTVAGPFDHGFFFESGVGARGGDSPYMN